MTVTMINTILRTDWFHYIICETTRIWVASIIFQSYLIFQSYTHHTSSSSHTQTYLIFQSYTSYLIFQSYMSYLIFHSCIRETAQPLQLTTFCQDKHQTSQAVTPPACVYKDACIVMASNLLGCTWCTKWVKQLFLSICQSVRLSVSPSVRQSVP